jgi:hypothetical protein
VTDIVLPLSLKFARARARYIENVGVSRATYTGKARTSELGGDRVGFSLEVTPSQTAERRAIIALMNQIGRRNRLLAYDPAYRAAGSFPAPELFTNSDFTSAPAVGWSAYTDYSVSHTNGVRRVTTLGTSANGTAAPGAQTYPAYQAPTRVSYAPYAVRAALAPHIRASGTNFYPYDFDILANTSTPVPAAGGIATHSGVVNAGGSTVGLLDQSIQMAGISADITFMSYARCILADGGPNLLLQSDVFGTTWTLGGGASAITSNTAIAPDGTGTGDTLQETGTGNVEHYVQQNATVTSAVQDISFSCSVISSTRGWCALRMAEGGTSTFVYVFINLSTGAVGTTFTGTGWSNTRVTVTSQGFGWWRIALTSRKTTSGTTISCLLSSATADGAFNYAGTVSQNAIGLWRGSLAVTGVPVRGTQTTTTAASAEVQTGSAIYVKGLPASTTGLLLAGDQVEITTSYGPELKFLTADLDSNAAGLGYLQFAPALRGSVADNAAIIVNKPMGRFIWTGEMPEWLTDPGVISTASLEFEEA